MKATRTLLQLAALCSASAILCAQDPQKTEAAGTGTEQPPNPVTKHHNALAAFVGDWNNICKMNAMPGVPGMEKAAETTGTEHAELVCNGLYLKSIVNGSFAGEPFQGLWIAAYDRFNNTYRTVWVDVMEPSPSLGTGSYDAETKTWTFEGDMPQGAMRSVLKFDGANKFSENCFVTPKGGKESETMVIVRDRAQGDAKVAVDAAAKNAKPSKELEPLVRMVGDWNATVRMQMAPDAPWTEEKATERVTALCGGKWLWTDFQTKMMGMPFEGHALLGYDAAKGEYVSFWIDSWTPVPLHSTGKYDGKAKAVKMHGKGIDMMGRAYTSKDEASWKDDNTRVFKIQFDGPDGTQNMEITYTRKK